MSRRALDAVTADVREVKTVALRLHAGARPQSLRQRLLADMANSELRQKYLATRRPAWARADLAFARRRLLALEVAGRVLGLAALGGAGGLLGFVLCRETIPAVGPVATGFKAAVGAGLAAAVVFAVLGACGHVVFGEIVGDYRDRRRRKRGAWGPLLLDGVVEFIGGAVWGAVCGMACGGGAALAQWTLALNGAAFLGMAAAGAGGGAALGLLLAGAALLIRHLGGLGLGGADHAALGPLPLLAYLHSPARARRRFLRRTRSTVKAPGELPPQPK